MNEWPVLSEVELSAKHPRSGASIKELRGQLAYDPKTGDACTLSPLRKVMSAPAKAPDMSKGGYLFTYIRGCRYRTHVLVFALYHGRWPVKLVDHFDGNKTNNSISNLREVSAMVNSQNRLHGDRGSASGLLGVCKDAKQPGKWKAYITCSGKTRSLGSHGSADAAHHVYLQAKRRLHAESWLASADVQAAGVQA